MRDIGLVHERNWRGILHRRERFPSGPALGLRSQSQAKVRVGGVQILGHVGELEAENAKLKRMYADLALENAAIKDVLSRKL